MARVLGRSHIRNCRFAGVAVMLLSTVVVSADEGAEAVRDALDRAAVLLSSGKADAALDALEAVERREPGNPWLWFYRGHARLQLDEPYLAMEDLDRAAEILHGLGNPERELSRRIAEVRATARRQVFSLSLTTGLAFDTNVTFLGGGASTLGLIAGEEDGKFASTFGAEFSPVADSQQKLTFGVRTGHAWHFSIESFNYQDYGGFVRYARRLTDSLSLSVRYDYDFTYLGNEPFLSNHALRTALSYEWSDSDARFRPTVTEVYYLFEHRDFRFDVTPRFDQDGFVHGVGVEQRFELQPLADSLWTWDLRSGYEFARVATDGTEFDRRTHAFFLGLSMPMLNPMKPYEYLLLPEKPLTFHFDVGWLIADHLNESLDDRDHDRRSDLVTTYGFGLSQVLMDDPEYGEMVLHAIIHWTDSESNVETSQRISPFTYDKVVYGIQLAWSW